MERECIDCIQSPADWEGREDELRRQLHEMLGLDPLPERTDLQPVITGKVDHEEFTVENIHFQSSPGLYVTGNLYIPKTGKPPYPAVLQPTGHSTAAKNRAFYQTLAIGLVIATTLAVGLALKSANSLTYSPTPRWLNKDSPHRACAPSAPAASRISAADHVPPPGQPTPCPTFSNRRQRATGV
jgi:hypothetical protein